jgi:hypothetical protein
MVKNSQLTKTMMRRVGMTSKVEEFVHVAPGDFCLVHRSYDEGEVKVESGDIMYVCGEGFLPENEDDPYLFRKIYAVAPMDGDHVLVTEKPLLVKGNYLVQLPEARQVELQDIFIEDHADAEPEEEPSAA